MVISDLLSDFDFDQIPSREQRTVQKLQYSHMQFCSALLFYLLEYKFSMIGC